LSGAEPAPLWRRLPPTNRKRLLWLMSQLLERRLAQTTAAREEESDESE
jgi:acyl-CoA reductase-like NAD-dependent aldehyde dehydrogenase